MLVSSKTNDKRDEFDFGIVNFPSFDGDVPRRASYGVHISQLIRLARVCNHVAYYERNICLTAKLLDQGYRYHKLRKTFSKFYRRHYDLISKFNDGLKTLPRQYFCGGSFCFMSWCLFFVCVCCWRLMYVFIFLIKLR